MNQEALKQLLQQVQAGDLEVDEAIKGLKNLPFESMGFATLDHHRALRCGFPEVIYCPGKTVEQVRIIFGKLADVGGQVLATRASQEQYDAVVADIPAAEYHSAARAITLRQGDPVVPVGNIAIVAAGTSDLPVAHEARVTAEIMGAQVSTYFDVGVAGLHRLLACKSDIQDANVIVAVAGMEGALASVVGGLVDVPVIAVPTSIGYGASFGGVAALLAMLNSCASGISVVNIDNGFAGGYISAMINRQTAGAKNE
ncbi:MAG: nickel pincer cofactor biosynthesis protein LarB [Phycisphaerales bacterium]|jgi:pyridinium-3,5-biscarboxylic acid mononucleotide synthase|nr:nickel pincer cofactor biosynthesis protein LarB [Phycisphaerales bacterium]